MKTALDYFNKTASEWSENWLNEKKKSGVAKTFFELFQKAKNKHPKILDAGCGSGYDSYILKNLGARVVGVDFSEKSIEIAKNNVAKCDFYVKNIEDGLAELGLFDGIFCTSALNFIDVTKLRVVFNNFTQIMKNGALLFISVMDGNGKNEQKSFSMVEGEEYDLKFFNISAEQLCSLASPELKLVDTFRFDDYMLGYKYYVFIKI